MNEKELNLQTSLKSAKKRNPDAFKIIAIVSGVPEVKIKGFADGDLKLTPLEITALDIHK